MKKGLFFAGAIILITGLFVVGYYNGIVALNQNVKTKWANVEAQYQRRGDLVPNLVKAVKGAANFEQETFARITEARAKATAITIDPGKLTETNIQKFQQVQNELGSALGRLLAVAENYPQLTATANFREFQSQLEGTENRIMVARKDFNDAVLKYNTKTTQFPGNIAAKIFGFEQSAYFAAENGSASAPVIDF